jgi:hypothetical protein
MDIYHYHPSTQQYLGFGSADPDPLEPGNWLIPAHATTIAPPEALLGFNRYFTGTAWEYRVVEPEDTPEVQPDRTLAEAKALKREELNAERDSHEAAGFMFGEHLLDSNERSVLRITVASMTARLAVEQGQPYSIEWTTAENYKITLTGEQVMSLPYYLALNAQALHDKCGSLKALVEAATTVEEVEAINWDTPLV